MNVRELIEALSAMDQDLPVKIRERGALPVPCDVAPPFERHMSGSPWLDHVLLEVEGRTTRS